MREVRDDVSTVLAHANDLKPKDRERLEKARRTLEEQSDARARGAKLDKGKVNHALGDIEKSLQSPAVAAADRDLARQHIADLRTHTVQRQKPPKLPRRRRFPY